MNLMCLADLISLWISNDPTKGHQAPESAFSECLVDNARDSLAQMIGRYFEKIGWTSNDQAAVILKAWLGWKDDIAASFRHGRNMLWIWKLVHNVISLILLPNACRELALSTSYLASIQKFSDSIQSVVNRLRQALSLGLGKPFSRLQALSWICLSQLPPSTAFALDQSLLCRWQTRYLWLTNWGCRDSPSWREVQTSRRYPSLLCAVSGNPPHTRFHPLSDCGRCETWAHKSLDWRYSTESLVNYKYRRIFPPS